MAYLQVNLLSRCLMRTVPVNVILPVDKLVFPGQPEPEEKPLKTLYLLHGIFGSYVDWVNGTRIQRYADENDLAVVMPSGDNAFYVDQAASNNFYGEFVGRELVELTRRMFPLSRKREDTYIGGLSMGGYGAMRNGLKYADTFGAIISLSGAMHFEEMAERSGETGFFMTSGSYVDALFGDRTELREGDCNPKVLARRLHDSGKPIPRIYMACGDKDSLLPANNAMAEYLRQLGADITYEVGPGAHEWDFWDTYIKRAIEWLPTVNTGTGINSGNVGI